MLHGAFAWSLRASTRPCVAHASGLATWTFSTRPGFISASTSFTVSTFLQVASATSGQGCAAERRPRPDGGRFVLPSCWPQRSSRSCPCSRSLLLRVQPGTVGREEEYYAIAGERLTPACGGRAPKQRGPPPRCSLRSEWKKGNETTRLDEAVEAMAARGREALW